MTTDRRLLARMRELCAELGPDDGIDPRTLKKSDSSTPTHHRLAGQVARAVRQALASSDDPVLLAVWVARALPDPDATRFRIDVGLMDPGIDEQLALQRLRAAKGWVRSEVARIVNRRKTPNLRFAWAPPEEGP